MLNEKILINVPEDILKNWQEIVSLLAQVCQVPAALIMRLNEPDIEVFASNEEEGNLYHYSDTSCFDQKNALRVALGTHGKARKNFGNESILPPAFPLYSARCRCSTSG